MGFTGKCPNCKKAHRWDSGEIITLKSLVKYGVICPNCGNQFIIIDEIKEGPKKDDNWTPNEERGFDFGDDITNEIVNGRGWD